MNLKPRTLNLEQPEKAGQCDLARDVRTDIQLDEFRGFKNQHGLSSACGEKHIS